MSRDFFSDIVISAKVFGLGVGDDLSAFDSRLKFDHFGEDYGWDKAPMLRRDYGLFEATFVGSPAWRCSNLIVEVHRLASMAALVDEVKKMEGPSLPQYVVWADVRQAIHQADGAPQILELERVGTSARYGIVESGVVIDVLDDDSSRTDQPGSGDIWSISLTGASNAVR